MLKQIPIHPTSTFIIVLCIVIVILGILTVVATTQNVYINPSEIKQRNSKVLTVDDGGGANYTEIQSAIDNASAGDTIYVNTGTYYEKVTLTKSINLIGEDKEKTVICNPGIIVYVNTTEATIKNFTIMEGEINIYISNAININISNCDLSYANRHGIYFEQSSNNTITDTQIFSSIQDGLRLDYFSSYNTISSCSISHNKLNGISVFQSSNNNMISNTDISSNGIYGIFVTDSSHNIILNSNISTNRHGIYLSNSSHNFITNSTVNFSDYVGVGINHSSSNIITNCTVADNYAGLHLFDSATNLIFHNNFINNTYQAFDFDNNSWDNGKEGNYWSDYTGEDTNGDGIGDIAYIIDHDSRDRFPLITPFNGIKKQQISTEERKWWLPTISVVSIVIMASIILVVQAIRKKIKQRK